MKQNIFKVIKKHKRNCGAVKNVAEGKWTTPWFFKEFYYFRKWKRVGRLVCNSTDCKAELRIDVKEIEEKYSDLLESLY